MIVASQPAATGVPGVPLVLAVAGAVIIAVALTEVILTIVHRRGHGWVAATLVRRTRVPLRLLLLSVLVWLAVRVAGRDAPVDDGWRRPVDQAMAALTIVLAAWLATVITLIVVQVWLGRHRQEGPGNRFAKGDLAQLRSVRRFVVTTTVLAAAAGVLLVLDRSDRAGWLAVAVLLAWLGAVGVAAFGWLRAAVAGVQLAVSDAVRLDDVIEVDGAWGRVEAMTAGYVLVQTWDDRRLVVPATRLTTGTFENWTRREADLVGTVDIDLPLVAGVGAAEARAELARVLELNDLWDRRVGVLQVSDATDGTVRLTAVVSAADVPALMDLRCDVREALVDWWRRRSGAGSGRTLDQPVVRVTDLVEAGLAEVRTGETSMAGHTVRDTTVTVDPRRDSRLFTGSIFAVERSQVFTGPGAEVQAERELDDQRA